MRDVEVYAHVDMSLNGREYQPLVKSDIDLTTRTTSPWQAADYITEFTTPFTHWIERQNASYDGPRWRHRPQARIGLSIDPAEATRLADLRAMLLRAADHAPTIACEGWSASAQWKRPCRSPFACCDAGMSAAGRRRAHIRRPLRRRVSGDDRVDGSEAAKASTRGASHLVLTTCTRITILAWTTGARTGSAS